MCILPLIKPITMSDPIRQYSPDRNLPDRYSRCLSRHTTEQREGGDGEAQGQLPEHLMARDGQGGLRRFLRRLHGRHPSDRRHLHRGGATVQLGFIFHKHFFGSQKTAQGLRRFLRFLSQDVPRTYPRISIGIIHGKYLISLRIYNSRSIQKINPNHICFVFE